MYVLYIILIIIFIFSLILNHQSNISQKTAFEIVNEMRLGYNLGNSFDSYNNSVEIKNPNEQITLFGNPIPTKQLISRLKKCGFKTIRFPVTWINFIDEYGNINHDWILRVKEVANWIISKNMYCIINIHNDGEEGNWLYDGLNAKEKYITLWSQIAEELKDLNEYFIFESMNKPIFYNRYYDRDSYDFLLNFTQAFVDIVRNSGGFNKKRLLIISGINAVLEYTCTSYYKMPKDPYNKLAISIHYFDPNDFTIIDDKIIGTQRWGSENDYKELLRNFNTLKEFYLDKKIPVILGEIGVITEKEKDIASIHEYLYAIIALSSDYDGMMSCLWDTSNKKTGNMNYYDRVNNRWYDKKIQDFIYKISKKKHIHSSEFYYMTNLDSTIAKTSFGDYNIILGKNKPLKIFLSVNAIGELFDDYFFSIFSYDKTGVDFAITFGKKNMKKRYDGTILFTVDISNIDCHETIQIINWTPSNLTLNNATVEFKEKFLSFDYNSYKEKILKDIN
jgi:endoglucanase